MQRATRRCFKRNINNIVKKKDLEKRLRSAGCYLKREGSAHSVWINPKTGEQETVPRHNEKRVTIPLNVSVIDFFWFRMVQNFAGNISIILWNQEEIIMQTKLTLRMEKQLIELAEEYASERGKSVSQLVADYFALLNKAVETKKEELSPIAGSLKGSLRGVQVNESDYKRHLEEKYL